MRRAPVCTSEVLRTRKMGRRPFRSRGQILDGMGGCSTPRPKKKAPKSVRFRRKPSAPCGLKGRERRLCDRSAAWSQAVAALDEVPPRVLTTSKLKQSERTRFLASNGVIFKLTISSTMEAKCPALQDFHPIVDIGGMVLPHLGGNAQVGTKESGTEFGYQFFHRITFISPPFATEFPIESRAVPRPVG